MSFALSVARSCRALLTRPNLGCQGVFGAHYCDLGARDVIDASYERGVFERKHPDGIPPSGRRSSGNLSAVLADTVDVDRDDLHAVEQRFDALFGAAAVKRPASTTCGSSIYRTILTRSPH